MSDDNLPQNYQNSLPTVGEEVKTVTRFRNMIKTKQLTKLRKSETEMLNAHEEFVRADTALGDAQLEHQKQLAANNAYDYEQDVRVNGMRSDIEEMELAEQLAEMRHGKKIRRTERKTEIAGAKHTQKIQRKNHQSELRDPPKKYRPSKKEMEQRRAANEAKKQKEQVSEIREHVATGAQGSNMRNFMKVRDEVNAEYKAKGQPVPEDIQQNLKNAFQLALAQDNHIE